MSLYIAFFPGLGLEVQHWHGKASGAALLGGEPGVLSRAVEWASHTSREGAPVSGRQKRQAHTQWSSQELHSR